VPQVSCLKKEEAKDQGGPQLCVCVCVCVCVRERERERERESAYGVFMCV
jgi:hypothetical protein